MEKEINDKYNALIEEENKETIPDIISNILINHGYDR